MYLLIDGQPLQTRSRDRGIGRYSANLIAALRQARPEWRIEVVHATNLPPLDSARMTGCRLRAFEPPLARVREHVDACERYYADWLTGLAPDAILLLNFFEGDAWVPRFLGPRPPLFGVLYDLIPLRFPEAYLRRSEDYMGYAGRLRQMAAADGLLAISEATARDFCQLLVPPRPEVRVIGGAPDRSFARHSPRILESYRRRFRRRFGLDREFILYVGGADFRKNLQGAIEAFALLPAARRSNRYLVIACDLSELSPDRRQKLQDRAKELGVAESVKLTGYVSDDELRALYQLCRLFFFPSLYEGLGLPVLEALQCGTPVVAGNAASVPEIAGDVSWLADPRSPSLLAGALEQALAEPRTRRESERVAHARSFTWQRSTELACPLLETPVPPSPHKPRLAWVAPLPPMLGALANHAAELLEQLAERYEIELVVAPNQPLLAKDLEQRHFLIQVHEIPARHAANPYDLFVYHVGNSPQCLFELQLLQRFPGLLVLHDEELGALAEAAVRASSCPSMVREPDMKEVVDFVGRLLHAAEGIVAHSARTWQRVRGRTSVPVVCAPMTATLNRAEDSARYAAFIDRLIQQRADREATWVHFATESLRDCDRQAAETLIETWSALRWIGQQQMCARHRLERAPAERLRA